MNVRNVWRADNEIARADLEASGAQAFLVAAFAFAWRATTFFLPTAILLFGSLLVAGIVSAEDFLLAVVVSVLGPQGVTFLGTFPIGVFAALQGLVRGSHGGRSRFGSTGFVFIYYGWRYAFRGRTRPWGALSREERLRANPKRMGVQSQR